MRTVVSYSEQTTETCSRPGRAILTNDRSEKTVKEQISKSLVADFFIQIKISSQAVFFKENSRREKENENQDTGSRCIQARQLLGFRGFLAFCLWRHCGS